ncbi:MAG: Glyoxalase/bleomycin resistance protein/dioxygenase [Gemmatimonadetes bacterium]|nr:Glyoxalase/bleomycin resistance protein/dioxygenase [Gemmatimonadota bacterium]
MPTSLGIHHVTGIARNAQQNVDFYAGVLGLRLVKKTVNFDDPDSYHLYYGDELGSPGSVLTFFPWPRALSGRAGVGEVAVTSLAIAPRSIGYWLERFVTKGVEHAVPTRRFGESVIAFKDRDGLQLDLVATESADGRGHWSGGSVPAEHAIHGVHSVTLWEHSLERTEQVLVNGLGFSKLSTEDTTTRFVIGDGGASRIVDVRVVGGFLAPIGGAGTIHHVAFRAENDAAELELRNTVIGLGMHPTPVIDREYFHSVYFREPGGVLFELATDAPGFTVDETLDALGTALKLPPQYEARRAEIEQRLAPIHEPLMPPLLGIHESDTVTS